MSIVKVIFAYCLTPYTQQPTSLLIFKKGSDTQKVWFFDVREDGFSKNNAVAGRDAIAENDLPLLRSLWREKLDSSHSFSVTVEQIREANYHLALNHYQPLPPTVHTAVPLGSLCHIFVGQTPYCGNSHFYGGQNLWVRIKDMEQRIVHRTQRMLTDAGVQQSRLKALPKDTLLFSFRLTIGKVAFAGEALYTSDAIAGLMPKDDRVLSQYLYYVLPHLDYSPYVNRGAKGQTLNKRMLAKVQIPLPPLEVQKKAVRILEAAENKQTRYLQRIETLKQWKCKKIGEWM